MHVPALISDLALMLLVAGVTTLLFKKLRQPVVLGYILAGFFVGPYFNPFPNVVDMVSINTWSEIGIIILMFSLGLEFNLHKLASVGGTAIITAISEVGGMLFVGFFCGKLMGWSTMDSVFLGGMLSMSSTTIIIKAFDDLNLKGKKFTELVFGILIIEDIAGIFMMVILSTVAANQEISGGELVGSLLKMLLYLALWLILGTYLLPTVLKRTKKLMNEETLLIASLGICLGMVLLANALGFSSALGAFLAGSLLAGTIHAEEIERISKPIKDLFGAIFFISVGMMVNPDLIVQYIGPIALIIVATIVGKAFFSSLGVLLSGQPLKTAVSSGFSLAQIGEFSFIIASMGISLGVISDYIYPIVVSVSVITTFTTPYVIRASDGAFAFINKSLPSKLVNYLNRHTSEDKAETEKSSSWSFFIKKYFFHLTFYVIVMLGIILGGISFLWPLVARHLAATPAAVLSLFVIFLFMAPFLRQCLFQKNAYFSQLWFESNSNRLPLIVLSGFRFAVMIFLIMLPIWMMFSFPFQYILLVALVLLFAVNRSDWLITPYLKIEVRFLTNFNERKLKQRKKAGTDHSWLDQQIYVVKIDFNHESTVLNQPLSEIFGPEHSGVRVIKIIRNGRHINIPKGTDKILPGDTVFIAGKLIELNHLDMILKIDLAAQEESWEPRTLHDFINQQEQYAEADQLLCYAITVEKGSSLAGTRIKKNSTIHNEWGSLLLGLERDLYPIISPNINMRIQENDLLWILGSQKTAGKLAKADLL